jgi:hypothetical protein
MKEKIPTVYEIIQEYKNRQHPTEYYSIKILLCGELLTYENVSNLKEGVLGCAFDCKIGYGTPVHIFTEGRVVLKAIRIKE